MSKRRTTLDDPAENVSNSAEALAELSSLAHPTEQDVAELAYRRWVDRGRPQWSPEEDWFEAERELASLKAS
jgi:hypothetical protein